MEEKNGTFGSVASNLGIVCRIVLAGTWEGGCRSVDFTWFLSGGVGNALSYLC